MENTNKLTKPSRQIQLCCWLLVCLLANLHAPRCCCLASAHMHTTHCPAVRIGPLPSQRPAWLCTHGRPQKTLTPRKDGQLDSTGAPLSWRGKRSPCLYPASALGARRPRVEGTGALQRSFYSPHAGCHTEQPRVAAVACFRPAQPPTPTFPSLVPATMAAKGDEAAPGLEVPDVVTKYKEAGEMASSTW